MLALARLFKTMLLLAQRFLHALSLATRSHKLGHIVCCAEQVANMPVGTAQGLQLPIPVGKAALESRERIQFRMVGQAGCRYRAYNLHDPRLFRLGNPLGNW